MANALGELFGDIASAIREKTGDAEKMKPAQFPEKIGEIETGADVSGVTATAPHVLAGDFLSMLRAIRWKVRCLTGGVTTENFLRTFHTCVSKKDITTVLVLYRQHTSHIK